MKKINQIVRILLGVGILAVFLFTALSLWRLWQQSRSLDTQTIESLLPSLNIGAIRQAAGLLR
jgi:hypothetical protein